MLDNKIPFILKNHEVEFSKLKELRASDLEYVHGGGCPAPTKETMIVTPNGDGGDGGCDSDD